MPASIDDLLKEQQKTTALLAAIYPQVLAIKTELIYAKIERQRKDIVPRQYKPYSLWERFRYWWKGEIGK